MENSTAHVEPSKSKNLTIFKVFDGLIKSSHKREKSCAALIDFLQDNVSNVGSTSSTIYTAKRLIRGLSSSEEEKKNMFFSSLCTTLCSEIISAEDALVSLKNIVDNAGSSNSAETAAHVSTILTYGALALTDKISTLPHDEQIKIVDELLATCNSKKFLKRAASVFLLEVTLNSSKEFAKAVLLPTIQKAIEDDKNREREFVTICGVAYLKHAKVFQKVIDKHLGGRSKFLDDLSIQTSFFHPSRQEDIIKLMCVDFSLSGKGKAMAQFWIKALEKDQKPHPAWNSYLLLFAQVILEVLPDGDTLPQCFHSLFIDLLLKSLHVHPKKGNEDLCYQRAKIFLEKLTTRVADEVNKSVISLKIIQKIISHPGGLLFDRKTKSNTLQALTACLGADETKLLAEEFVSMINEITKSSKNLKDVPLIVTMLAKLLAHPEIKKDTSIISQYAKYIFDLVFLKSQLSGDIKARVSDAFYKAIELNHVKLNDAVVVLNDVVLHVESNMPQLKLNWSEQNKEQWKNMLSANQKMVAKSGDKKYLAVRILLLQMALLMFRDENLASSTIEELLQCYQRIKDRKVKRKSKSNTDADDAVDEPHWVEVTVDLLLAMLSQENKLLRHVVSAVFPSIAPYLTATALQQIVDALDTSSRNDVLKHMDSDDSDQEMDDGDDASDDADDFEDEEDSAPSGEDEEETVNDKLRMAVRTALGYSAALTDDEDVDMDEMNPEEETRLNESLANAFRLFRPSKGSKKKQSKDDEALMHFRIRVLDLVEIVATNSPPLSSCIELLNPLFDLLEISIKDQHQRPLQNRLEAILKKLGGVKKFGNLSDTTYKDVVAAMKRLLERDTTGMVSAEMAPSVTECAGLLMRASQLLTREEDDIAVEAVLVALMDRYFVKNDRKVPYSVFQQALRMLWDGNWHVSRQIMTYLLDVDLKIFKKVKLVELLEIFYRNDRLHSTATDDCKKAACQFESKFVKKFAKVLADHSTKNPNLLPAFYSRLVLFIQLAIQSKTKYRENCTPAPNWKLVITELVQQIHLLSQQKARNKLILLAHKFEVPVPDKEQLKKLQNSRNRIPDEAEQEAENTTEEQEKREVRKRKSGETGHKKKESKERRCLVSSEGLDDVPFSAVPTYKLPDIGSEEPVTKKTKKEKSHKKKSKGGS